MKFIHVELNGSKQVVIRHEDIDSVTQEYSEGGDCWITLIRMITPKGLIHHTSESPRAIYNMIKVAEDD